VCVCVCVCVSKLSVCEGVCKCLNRMKADKNGETKAKIKV
jgi:hypothetical protein